MKRKNAVIAFLVVLLFCAMFVLTYLVTIPKTPRPSEAPMNVFNAQPTSNVLNGQGASSGNLHPKVDSDLLNATFLNQESYIENGSVRVIVKFSSTQNRIADEANSLGGDFVEAFPEMNLEVLNVPYSALDQLAGLPDVTHVYLDRKIQALDTVSLPLIEPPSEWATVTASYGALTGVGVKIAILDTGIDPTHADFFFPNGTSKILNATDFSDSGHTYDGNGHGTHCASIAAGTGAASGGTYVGVAPNAMLLNAKVLGDGGSGLTSWAVSGVQWAVNQGASILSMSFGAGVSVTDGSDAMSQAVDWATSQGIVCCVAAGNYGPSAESITSPACAKTAITVGSCDSTKTIASTSSRGPTTDYRIKPEVIAPGVNIIAARANNTSLGTPINQYYTRLSGTSMAAPHVSGAVALIKQAHPSWTVQQIKSALVESANVTSVTPESDIASVGNGLIDVANAITVTTFASNATMQFSVSQVYNPMVFNYALTFSPTATFVNVDTCLAFTDLPFPVIYSSNLVVFNCPANTTAAWYGRLNFAGGCMFKPQISIPILAITSSYPPSDSAWTAQQTFTTQANWPRAMVVSGDKLYVADSYVSGNILEFSLPSMTLLRNVSVPETMINSLVISEGNLYAGTTYGFIFQIPLSTFQVQAEAHLPGNLGITDLLVFNSKLYATTYNGLVYRIDTANLNLLTSKSIDADIQAGVVANSNFYFVTEKGNLWKINPSTLTGSKVSLNVTGFGLNSLTAANNYLYAVSNNEPFFPQLFKVTNDLTVLNAPALVTPYGTDSLELAYGNKEIYVIGHIFSNNYTYQADSLFKFDSDTLTAEALLNYNISNPVTTGGWSDKPFLCAEETIVVWKDYVICSYDSGKIGLTRDTSQKTAVPVYISSNVNSTSAGQPCQISTWWSSKAGLSGFIVSTNNTGTWINQTLQSLTGNFASANFSFALSSNNGSTLAWKFYCQDINNLWSDTDVQYFNITSSQYYTLTILPSHLSGTNPSVGQYSYPSATTVNVSINEASTGPYKFQNWLLDGVNKTGKYVLVVMNQNHTVQIQDTFTNDTVPWEKFLPSDVTGSAFPIGNVTTWANSPYHAQTFTVGNTSHTVSSVKLFIYKKGTTTGPLVVSIKATSKGLPVGPDLANATVNLASLSTDYPGTWVTIQLTYPSTPIVLGSKAQYAVVASDPTDTGGNCPYWQTQYKITQFSGGDFYRLKMDTLTWQLVGDADNLFPHMPGLFQILGEHSSQHTIAASAGVNGTISPSGAVTVENGSSRLFTITPDAHFHVVDVLVDGVSVGAVTSYTFTNIQADHTISASFTVDTFAITASAGSGGTINPSGTAYVTYGTYKLYNITANTNYHINSVLVDSVSVGAVNQYNFTNIGANHTIIASFAVDSTPTQPPSGGGDGGGSSTSSISSGSTVTPSPKPNATPTPQPTDTEPQNTLTPTATPNEIVFSAGTIAGVAVGVFVVLIVVAVAFRRFGR
jgi:subtilisin family serine protease